MSPIFGEEIRFLCSRFRITVVAPMSRLVSIQRATDDLNDFVNAPRRLLAVSGAKRAKTGCEIAPEPRYFVE